MGWLAVGLVWLGERARARLGPGDLDHEPGSVALYARPLPFGGPSASALDGVARDMAMAVACREAKERGIGGAARGFKARLVGVALAGLGKRPGPVCTGLTMVMAAS